MDSCRILTPISSPVEPKSSRSSSISDNSSTDDDLSSRMSITDLLAAAEFLERSERQKDSAVKRPLSVVCPATLAARPLDQKAKKRCFMPIVVSPPQLMSESKASVPLVNNQISSSGNTTRASHNELEKNRRAHLRSCLEKLKDLIPTTIETNRYTTLSLLTKATSFIKSLEDQKLKLRVEKDMLLRQQEMLKKRLQPIVGSTVETSTRCASAGSLRTQCFNNETPIYAGTLNRPNSMPDEIHFYHVEATKRKRSISECSESTISADEIVERNADLSDDDETMVSDLLDSTNENDDACTPTKTIRSNENISFFVPTVITNCTPTTSTTVSSSPTAAATGSNVADCRINKQNNFSRQQTELSCAPLINSKNITFPRFVVPPCVPNYVANRKENVESTSVLEDALLSSIFRPKISANPDNFDALPDSSSFYEPLFSRLTLQALLDQYARVCSTQPLWPEMTSSPPCNSIAVPQALMQL